MTGLRTRLSIMMFLQFAIWGAWTTALGAHLAKIGYSGERIGAIYGCLWLGCMIAPFIGGQIADRWVPTQIFLSVAHLGGAVLLYLSAMAATDTICTTIFQFILFLIAISPCIDHQNQIWPTTIDICDFAGVRAFVLRLERCINS